MDNYSLRHDCSQTIIRTKCRSRTIFHKREVEYLNSSKESPKERFQIRHQKYLIGQPQSNLKCRATSKICKIPCNSFTIKWYNLLLIRLNELQHSYKLIWPKLLNSQNIFINKSFQMRIIKSFLKMRNCRKNIKCKNMTRITYWKVKNFGKIRLM